MNKSKIIYKINKSVKQSLINHDKSLGKIIVLTRGEKGDGGIIVNYVVEFG